MSDVILDHVQDKGAVDLHRYNQIYEFPDFVKQASPEETLQPTDLTLNVYADPRPNVKAYPCHTPASTYLSAVYFAEKQSHYRPKDAARVQERLDHFIEYWGIRDEIDTMRVKAASMTKTAEAFLTDADFAMVWVNDKTGEKVRNYRLKSAAEVRTAAEWLHANRDNMIYGDRLTIATRIVEKAAQFGAALGDVSTYIDKQAGLGICNPDEVATALRNRAGITTVPEQKQVMLKLATLVKTKQRAALNTDTLTKLAETVDAWDRGNGLVGHYTELLPRPEDFIFSVTYNDVKTATGNAVALQTGRIYDRTDFKKIALADLQGLFGNDIKDAVADGFNIDIDKLAEVAETMPRPDAENLERLLEEAGIPAIANHGGNAAGFSSAF